MKAIKSKSKTMKQTFVKNIHGYNIQFNRLLYPVKYCILNNDPENNRTRYLFERNETGMWTVNQIKLPTWLEEIRLHIHDTIEENERTLGDICLKY